MAVFIQINPNNHDSIYIRPEHITAIKKYQKDNLWNVSIYTIDQMFEAVVQSTVEIADKCVTDLMREINSFEELQEINSCDKEEECGSPVFQSTVHDDFVKPESSDPIPNYQAVLYDPWSINSSGGYPSSGALGVNEYYYDYGSQKCTGSGSGIGRASSTVGGYNASSGGSQ